MAELKIAVRLDSIPGVSSTAPGLRRALATAREIGASSVELCGRRLFPIEQLSDTGVRALRKMLDDLNLRVAALRFQTQHGYDRIEGLDRRVDATKAAMRAAYRLGAPLVVNQIGQVPAAPARPEPVAAAPGQSGLTLAMLPQGMSKSIIDPRWDTLRAVLDDLGRYGARVGAFLAAETGTEPGEHLAALLDASADSFVAVVLNPGQLIINRHSVPAAIKSLGHRIQLVSAVDGVLDLAAGRGLTVPLGQGIADFPNLIGQLEDIPYRGPFVVGRTEMESSTAIDELRQSATYLANL